METSEKKELRTWLYRLIDLTDQLPAIGWKYNGSSTPEIDRSMVKLRIHLESRHSLGACQIVEAMSLYRLIETEFRKTNVRLVDRIDAMIKGEYPIASATSAFSETALYYILILLDLEDILLIVTNWKGMDRLGKGKKVVEDLITHKIHQYRLIPNLQRYIEYIDNLRSNTSTGKTILLNAKQFMKTLLHQYEVRQSLSIQPPSSVFPGGVVYQESLEHFSLLSNEKSNSPL